MFHNAGMRITTNQPQLERLALSVADLAMLLGISQRHCWKLLAAGRLPKPIRFGRSVRWLHSDIVAHLEALKESAK